MAAKPDEPVEEDATELRFGKGNEVFTMVRVVIFFLLLLEQILTMQMLCLCLK